MPKVLVVLVSPLLVLLADRAQRPQRVGHRAAAPALGGRGHLGRLAGVVPARGRGGLRAREATERPHHLEHVDVPAAVDVEPVEGAPLPTGTDAWGGAQQTHR